MGGDDAVVDDEVDGDARLGAEGGHVGGFVGAEDRSGATAMPMALMAAEDLCTPAARVEGLADVPRVVEPLLIGDQVAVGDDGADGTGELLCR